MCFDSFTQESNIYGTKINEAKRLENESHNCATCYAIIIFTKKGLQLRSKPHHERYSLLIHVRTKGHLYFN